MKTPCFGISGNPGLVPQGVDKGPLTLEKLQECVRGGEHHGGQEGAKGEATEEERVSETVTASAKDRRKEGSRFCVCVFILNKSETVSSRNIFCLLVFLDGVG